MQGSDPDRPALAPHAILDAESRTKKAHKITSILTKRVELNGRRVLDIGAGSGHIAGHFVAEVGPEGEVVAVDRHNQLQVGGFTFVAVTDEILPFTDASFDIVITNHVIEHVGTRRAQLRHLQEIARVLKPGGLVYLAVPNRWQLMERHFRLPMLSWLPLPLASFYVRMTGRGSHYDCTPLSKGALRRLFHEAQVPHEDVTLEAMRLLAQDEMSGMMGRILARMPDMILYPLLALIPTHVVIGKVNEGDIV